MLHRRGSLGVDRKGSKGVGRGGGDQIHVSHSVSGLAACYGEYSNTLCSLKAEECRQ
jgi:hypothetical protein